jgi:hypothetical protein
MKSSDEDYFERVKQYSSENVEFCRYCEDHEDSSGYRKIKEKNKEVTWTKKHLPYIGPDYGVFPKVVFLGYDDPNPDGYSMDWLREYLGHPLNFDKHRAGQALFVSDLLGRSFPTISTLNGHLCSCVKKGTSDSMMHFLKQPCDHSWHILLDILSPDLIIIEGKKQWESSKQYLQGQGTWKASPIEGSPRRGELCTLEYNKREILVLFLYHPSRNWDSPKKPYYKEVVLPLIEACKKNMNL